MCKQRIENIYKQYDYKQAMTVAAMRIGNDEQSVNGDYSKSAVICNQHIPVSKQRNAK